MDVASKGAHSIIVDFIDLVHQRCPLLEGYPFLHRNFLIYQLTDKLVLIRLLSTAGIYCRECWQVVVVLVVCDNSQFIDWLKLPFPLYVVEYTVGESEELFVCLTAHSFTLLVTVCLNFGTHNEVSTHIGLYSFPLPFLAIKVHGFVIDKHFLYR